MIYDHIKILLTITIIFYSKMCYDKIFSVIMFGKSDNMPGTFNNLIIIFGDIIK